MKYLQRSLIISAMLLSALCASCTQQTQSLVLVKAEYGIEDTWIDVTDVVQAHVQDDMLNIAASNDLFGDPIEGTAKVLRVDYLLDEEPQHIEVPENGMLVIGSKAAAVAATTVWERKMEAHRFPLENVTYSGSATHRLPDPTKELKPTYLRCEYRVDPLGIASARPRLSWVVQSSERGQKQTAYRILAASSAQALENGHGDLWDTGKLRSDDTAQIEYDGKTLTPHQTCFWKVRVWDANGKPSDWSDVATWTTGLGDTDWGAQWIGYDRPMLDEEKEDDLFLPPPRYLRKGFAVDKPVRRALLTATALGLYEMRLNGARVGEDYFTPGWTDYRTRVYYQTYDVTDQIDRGENTLGAILADGWYAGYVGFGRRRHHDGEKTRLRARLEIEFKDGSSQTIVTDSSWSASTGPLLESDFLMGEAYDAQLEMPGWDEPRFEAEAGWESVDVTDMIEPVVEPHPGEPVERFAEIEPVAITETGADTYVFDMGQNFAGFVRLKVRGEAGDRITLRFAERLNPDGTVYTTNLRSARVTDTYICKGDGTEIWEPVFTFHGFQYVEVTGYPGEPKPDAITGVALCSAVPAAGEFACSDATANRLYSNIVWTQRANYIEVPTDCPQRDERLGWTGDAQVFVRTGAWTTDEAAFYTKWAVDMVDAQHDDGAFTHVAPERVAGGGGSAAWADAGVICPWTIYQVYGDTRILERHYDSMVAWVEYCRKNSENLLRPAKGFGDWLSINADTPKEVLATAYFARSTRLLADIAETLGKDDDAARFARLADEIREAFCKAYVKKNGRIHGDTQTGYVLALAFDLLPEAQRALAEKRLIDDIESRDGHLSTGFVGTKDLMPTLTKIGRSDVAYRLFHNDTFPSWGFTIRHGATSIWERWNGWTPERGFENPGMNSFAHYAFGAVGEWMFRTIGGIETDGPAFKEIVIRPLPGGTLSWADTRHESIRGTVATRWEIDETSEGEPECLRLDVTIPANATATIYVPADNVSHVQEGSLSAAEAEGLEYLRTDSGGAVFRAESGSYRFIVRPAPIGL